jgi:hypothetical protein
LLLGNQQIRGSSPFLGSIQFTAMLINAWRSRLGAELRHLAREHPGERVGVRMTYRYAVLCADRAPSARSRGPRGPRLG